MARWLRTRRGAEKHDSETRVFELLVIDGTDAGKCFTIEGTDVAIVRGCASTSGPGEVLLTDPTVSSRQAFIQTRPDGLFLEHRLGATNPTLVNGSQIVRERIKEGDRIQMGRTIVEVRVRSGASLSQFAHQHDPSPAVVERADPGATDVFEVQSDRTEVRQVVSQDASDLTEVRRVAPPEAWVTVESGVPGWVGRRFDLVTQRIGIGRDSHNEICVPERGVSRKHAEFVWEGRDLILVHHSATNTTHVNGMEISGRQVLHSGDEIRLADQVVLRLEYPGCELPATAPIPAPTPEPSTAASLRAVMEEKVRRDQAIEEEYGFEGSFLDIDVVDSYGLKVNASRPEHIILSFERFRAFATGVVEAFDGQVLNSNGDELMCFFEAPLQAVRCASALLIRLEEFNEQENLLTRPFCVRQGIHTGNSLVDRQMGVAYSPVLDVAGHLQKHADKNGLLVSEMTLKALPDGLPFELAGELETEKIPTYRLMGSLE